LLTDFFFAVTTNSSTRHLLQDTENLVTAWQERVTRRQSNGHISDSDDEATLSCNTPKKPLPAKQMEKKQARQIKTSPLPREASVLSDSGYALGYQSDSSNEGVFDHTNRGMKYNRAFK